MFHRSHRKWLITSCITMCMTAGSVQLPIGEAAIQPAPRSLQSLTADATGQSTSTGIPNAQTDAGASVSLDPLEATLVQVFDLLKSDHVDPVDPNRLLDAAIHSMIEASGDPFTTYFTADQFQQFERQLNLTYAGIGVTLQQLGDHVVIKSVMSGKPATTAGMMPGDVILSVDGRDITGMTIDAVGSLLLGAAGTDVQVMIQRGASAKPETIKVTRADIQLDSVYYQMTKEGLGYITIYDFADTTASEFEKALADLTQQGAKGIILDLRGNPGGLIDQALQIADDFLHDGTIISVKDAHGNSQTFSADASASDIPMAILVDKGSASAAEALAGSLQARHRATLVGTQTYGKGTMQEPIALPSGGFLKLTIAKYYFDNGFNPHGVGLTPDVALYTPTLQYSEAVQLLAPTPGHSLTYRLGDTTVSTDGLTFAGDAAPFVDHGVIYIPLRMTAEAFGHSVAWDSHSGSISWTVSGKDISALPGKRAMIDGTASAGLNYPIQLRAGKAFFAVPDCLRLIGVTATVHQSEIVLKEGVSH